VPTQLSLHRTLTTKWNRSKGVREMAVNIFMYDVVIETIGLVMRRSPKSKRQIGWSVPPNILSVKSR